jgi:glucan 1,3-beta-glucosidase
MSSTYQANYRVFRNVVTDFGADNTGKTDASAAIQKAISGECASCHPS